MAHETKYHVFSGVDYYPEGGIFDYSGSFDTLAEAVKQALEASSEHYQWAQVCRVTPTGELEEVPREQW